MGDERGHPGPFPKVRDLSSGKDVVKYAMVATALVPDYITKTGEDEDRPKEQQDQAQSKDIVMPCEESPENGKPKILEPSWGDGLEEGDCPLGGEDHQLPDSGEKNNSGKEEKEDPDPMTEEVKRLVEESKQPFNVRHVTLVELLGSRHVSEILVALGKCSSTQWASRSTVCIVIGLKSCCQKRLKNGAQSAL